ncbi:imidazolonepropionase [Anoxybacter fermentans]|uniref:Imidazolonepropionase n=2 Tax=Bacteria TaxID=2 RepID=A0A3S9T222_9FIRM|nr:imidazolonepropionase [Anoxybacter fermentans]AZR74611.1 imidazolonepropionase [Anoxybacter fermentans]
METVDLLIKNGQVVTAAGHDGPVAGENMNELEVLENGCVAVKGEQIVAVGLEDKVMSEVQITDKTRIIDATDKVVTPGLIDSHTHFIFGGSREDEFVMRIQGASYMEIMEAGGGILNTVRATRAASLEELKELGRKRLDWMLKMGTTTVESKSGYGLNLEAELKQLQASYELNQEHPMDIVNTFLGAHAWPEEYKDDHEGYIKVIIEEMLPKVKEAGLAEFCDVFCEKGVFSIEETREIMLAAKEMGFDLKLHADEMTSLGGAELAAELRAVSAEHLLMISDEGIDAMRDKGVMAVLLPATAFTLRKPYAPVQKMMEAGLPFALATDFNPGSSPTPSLPLAMTIACLYMQLTPEAVFNAVTINAAYALKRADQIGSIEVGKQADLVIFDIDSYRKIPYFYGVNLVDKVIKKGKVVVD